MINKHKSNIYFNDKAFKSFKMMIEGNYNIKSASSFCNQSIINHLLVKSNHENIGLNADFCSKAYKLSKDVYAWDKELTDTSNINLHCLEVEGVQVFEGSFKACVKKYIEVK